MMRKIFPVLMLLFVVACKKESTNNDPYALPDTYSNQITGASAHDLLSADKYAGIDIQIQYMAGYQPDADAIANLTAFLNSVCNKPSGITVTQQQLTANGADLTVNDVALFEKQNRTAYTSGNKLALYILMTDGADTSSKILGVSYRCTSICLFGKTIFNNSGGLGQVSRKVLEATVLEHELGHILGLVNTGSPMVHAHEDASHAAHCNSTSCLMYYQVESNSFGLFGNNVPTLDANCLLDLHSNGGK